MDIYASDADEGVIDIEKTRRELAGTSGITYAPSRQALVAEINAAVLLDIATSLRVIAREASLAMLGDMLHEERPIPEGGEDHGLDRMAYDGVEAFVQAGGAVDDFFAEGDLVHVIGLTDPGEIVGLGWDQGELFADVDFGENARGRMYVHNLERLHGDKPATHIGTLDEGGLRSGLREDEAPEGVEVAAELAADIDDDFDGDAHTAADEALAVLEANEAARKAAKKKGSKK